MRLHPCVLAFAASLLLAACGGDGAEKATEANQAAGDNRSAETESAEANAAAAQAASCPFRRTRDWVGSVERGHVRINGYVDVQMAGFRPALTPRPGGPPGTLQLDLAFAPAPNEPINDHARYERQGAPSYSRAEIWCGGERIESFAMVVVN